MKRTIGSILLVVCCSMACFAEEERVGFKLERGYLIVVKCSIGGLTDLTGIVDTGVSESVVDLSIVKRLGLATQADQATFLTQRAKVFAVSIPTLRLGSVTAGPVAGIATDLHSLTADYGISPDILIGMDVLERSNLLIDYKNHQLSFTSEAIPGLAHQMPLEGEDRVPLVAVEFRGKQLHLQVDTGSSGVMIYTPEEERGNFVDTNALGQRATRTCCQFCKLGPSEGGRHGYLQVGNSHGQNQPQQRV